jgi:hypothetical protein
MTFELSPKHTEVRDNARGLAHEIATTAREIDRTAVVPASLAERGHALTEKDLLSLVVWVEEVAVVSAAVALGAASAAGGEALRLAGLRGAVETASTSRGQIALAATALGIGRAALNEAVTELRRVATQPSGDAEKPQWVAADVATELDAARLMTYKAALTGTESDIAVARLLACAAASRAVDAAVRILGAAALTQDSPIERLTRDVRAIAVLNGSEEDQRAAAAAGLLPQQ